MCVVLRAVERINAAVRAGVPEQTVQELMNPEAQLPEVYPGAADLYQRELLSLQQQSPEVPPTRVFSFKQLLLLQMLAHANCC